MPSEILKAFLKYHIFDRLVLYKKAVQLTFWNQKTPIIIHTMAKVGSLSVYNSIKQQQPTLAVFHTHSLDVDEVQNDIDFCFENNIYPGSRSPVFLINDKIVSQQKPYKIITLFRDPIERNISAFFDAFKVYVGVKPEDYIGRLEHLETLFHKHLPYTYPLEWFDNHFFKDTQIDVYNYPFDAEFGHAIIQQGDIEVLIMNCYLEDALKEKLIGEFCNIPNFKLVNANITEKRSSGTLYKAFKNYIRFDKDYLDSYYNSKYATHFFTENQRKSAFNKWLKT